ncbi:MAG: hypothetical protein ACOCRK_05400 [bacterium]
MIIIFARIMFVILLILIILHYLTYKKLEFKHSIALGLALIICNILELLITTDNNIYINYTFIIIGFIGLSITFYQKHIYKKRIIEAKKDFDKN